MADYVRYSDDVETIEPEEQETFQKIIDAMGRGGEKVRAQRGFSPRTSHAKAHGLLKGSLRVQQNLPVHLRQGLFAEPRTYDVIARLSQNPGDLDDDREVSGPRGFSIKVMDVEGEMLPGHAKHTTQDWVLGTGPVFNAIGAKTFLAQIAPTERIAPEITQGVKGAVSTATRGANAALHAVGMHSAALDFLGHPFLHPLGETYYSQAPIRFGEYIAKLRLAPISPGLKALAGKPFKVEDYDGLRTAVAAYFENNDAKFELSVQLCTDLKTMPIENANVEWPEDESPYQAAAELTFPAQEAWSPARSAFVDEQLSFCPSHSLKAHRPLGSLMRARMAVYDVLSRRRREENGARVHEPRSVEEMPG